MKKIQIIKKELKQPCYICKSNGSIRGVACDACEGTGKYKENYYYHIAKGTCISGDTLK